MSQVTFNNICNEIGFMINKMETRFRKPVEGRKRVLLTLWKQVTNIDFRSIAHLFGIGRSTACTIFHEIVVAINTNLTPRYIRFPQGEALRSVTGDSHSAVGQSTALTYQLSHHMNIIVITSIEKAFILLS